MRLLAHKMQPHITVLSHISTDVTQPALYLTTKNGQKYLIGRIGEGFQRSLAQSKTKTTKLSGVFLTGQMKWKSVSGVPGMLLSFGDRDLGINRVYCGPGSPYTRTQKMVQSWENFSFHKPLVVQPDCSVYSDENVEISPLSLGDSGSYIVKMKSVRGRFMVAKAKELGIPPGPLFSQISNGESVTIPGTERVVQPHEVLGPAPIPTTALVLDLPTMHHVEEAIKTLAGFTESLGGKSDLKAVYYFFEEGIDLQSPLISQLIDLLGGGTARHFVSHPLTSPNFNTLTALSEFQALFRSEFPDHFSPLYSQPAQQPLSIPHAEVMQRLHLLSMEPREVDTSTKDKGKNKNKKQKIDEMPAPPISEEVSDGLAFAPCSELTEPEVFTLGTGASAPSKYRNVSSTLVRTPHGSVIFDCGEGTSNTLGRIFGTEGRNRILQEVRILYISHMHADHHLGGMQVLHDWIEQRKYLLQSGSSPSKLLLATPIYFHRFAQIWAELDGFSDDLAEHVELIDLESVCFGHRYSAPEFQSAAAVQQANNHIATITKGIKIEACTAKHCPYSYNGTVTLTDDSGNANLKISYSGDTRPNSFFAETIGQGSNLLIHEATHENDLHEEAVKKRHSTIGEALQISQQMKAENTVLTHISQRYPRLPTIGSEMETDNQYVYFGFDCMHTKLSQIKNVQQMIPKMSTLLESLAQEDDEE